MAASPSSSSTTTASPKGSPCIGVCSTTYGDIVCRGCYRFAHEVTDWNAYDGAQRLVVQQRLDALRAGAVARHLAAERIDRLVAVARSVKLRRTAALPPTTIAYEVLRRLTLWRMPLPWSSASAAAQTEGRTLLANIDREMLRRTAAHYERSYKASPE